MAVRVTRTSAQGLEIPTRIARVTRVSASVLEKPVCSARVSRVSVSMLLPYYTPADNEATVTRASAQLLDVPTRNARVTRAAAMLLDIPTRIARVTRVVAQVLRPWSDRGFVPTYAQWPSTLLQAFEYGAQEDPGDFGLRSNVGSFGPIQSFERSTVTVEQVQGTIILSAADKLVWETFFDTTIASGALPFTADLDNTGIVKLYKIASAPRVTPLGESWTLSLQVVIVDPSPVLS